MNRIFTAQDRKDQQEIIMSMSGLNNIEVICRYRNAVENAEQGSHFADALLPFYEMELLARMAQK